MRALAIITWKDLLFGERSMFENRILIGAIINADYIELRRFLEASSVA